MNVKTHQCSFILQVSLKRLHLLSRCLVDLKKLPQPDIISDLENRILIHVIHFKDRLQSNRVKTRHIRQCLSFLYCMIFIFLRSLFFLFLYINHLILIKISAFSIWNSAKISCILFIFLYY